MARVQTKERLPSDEENLTGIPSPDSVADSPCLKPSLSNGHCKKDSTTFTFPAEGNQKGVPEVQTWNPMSRRTRLEKRLIILAAILAMCSITMVAILFIQWRSGQMREGAMFIDGAKCTSTCTTPDCVASASRLISNMDPSVDPCQDFYEYSCGGWHRSNVIPEDEARYAMSLQLIKNLEIQCKDIIEMAPSSSEAVAITKARKFYRACMNEAVLNQRGLEPLRALIKHLHGWPVTNDGFFDETSWRLEDVLARARMTVDRNFIFQNRITVDARNSNAYIVSLDQPQLGLDNRDYFLQRTLRTGLKAYEDYMTKMALELRSGNEEADVRRQMQDVILFETKMANISVPPAARRMARIKNRKVKISQLQRTIPVIDWARYFRLILNTSHFNESMEVVLYSPEYLFGLNRILAETPNRTIANYLIWRAVMHTIDQMGPRARSIRQAFQKVVSGEQKEPARWKQCIDTTNHFMGKALGALFVQQHFDEKSKDTAFEMIKHIRTTLYRILNTTEWMDSETKRNALEKAYAVREQIGYEQRLLNNTYLDGLYMNIDIRMDRHFENTIQIWSDHAKKSFAMVKEIVNKYRWSTTPIVVNAYYAYASNLITFPAAILQPPYFSRQYSRSMNYGAIGVVIGHELIHGFDDKGRQFDRDGNINIWWSESSSRSFTEKSQCFIDQYSNYSYEDLGLNVNGLQTLGENIADNGGLKEAYMAYRHSVENGGGEEPPLPGLNLTHDQIFFLSFGQLWCGLHRDQDRISSIKSDMHSPLKFRVWGTVSNSEAFAEAFHCPLGSPMNPEKKCSVW